MIKKKQNDIKEVELCSSEENNDIIQICAILKDNNIAYIEKGVYPTFLWKSYNYSIKKIYVSSEDYNKASKLISGYVSYKDTNKQIDDDVYTLKIKKFENIILGIFIGIPVLLCVLGLIIQLIK